MARSSAGGDDIGVGVGGDGEREYDELLNRRSGIPPVDSTAFEIADAIPTPPPRHRRRCSCSTNRYLLSISLSFILLLLASIVVQRRRSDRSADRMVQSELQAIRLLKDQQSRLLTLWNQTLAPTDLKSALLDQIKLNAQIQSAILSSHPSGNASAPLPKDIVDNPVPVPCRRSVPRPARNTIEWKPKQNKYLLAICVSGQMSNHLVCLEKHMLFAALLDRVLVLPSSVFDYAYHRVIDIKHINNCSGRNATILFDEFSQMKEGKVRVDKFICYMASPPCYLDDDHVKKLKDLGISFGEMEVAWSEVGKKRSVGDVTARFTSDAEVLAIGDVFFVDLEDLVIRPAGPLADKCKTLIQPNRLITLTAQRFVQTFLGSNFVALHFRRHGFLKFCNVKKESCFFPIPQSADCILRVVERAKAPVVYLSTDADESETNLLQSMAVLNDRVVPLVKRPNHTSVEKWDALLYRSGLGGDNQVEAMLDKTISAMSSVFIGTSGSTFTDDILRLRGSWGYASECDEYLCQGEQPNYIAELQ